MLFRKPFNFLALSSLVIFILFQINNLLYIKLYSFFYLNNVENGKIAIKDCNCTRLVKIKTNIFQVSSKFSKCNKEAEFKGYGQKVISYSLYFKKNTSAEIYYLGGIEEVLKSMREIYPGWVMRVYTNVERDEKVCHLLCNNEDLDWCDVRHIPNSSESKIDLEQVEGTIWRAFPLGDQLVDKFLVRDIDSPLTLRERACVDEWLTSNFKFHGMRDHPLHSTSILAGLWAVDNVQLGRGKAEELFHSLVKGSWRYGKEHDKNVDQPLLDQVLFQKTAKDWMVHDSYLCNGGRFGEGETRPFPTQRLPGPEFVFVGYNCWRDKCQYLKKNIIHCPVECRPAIGKNWTYC